MWLGAAGWIVALASAAWLAACTDSSTPTPADAGLDLTGADARGADQASAPDQASVADQAPFTDAAQDAAQDATQDVGVDAPLYQQKPGLPFTYVRPAAGTPVSAAELAAVTDKYLEILEAARYLDVLEERSHGCPETDPQGRYWYGTWWGGVLAQKSQGQVTYFHVAGGSDNNGIPTSAVMESACYAYLMWPGAKTEHVTRKLMRGFTSWILAMERQPNDPAGVLLSRAAYLESVMSYDGGKPVLIDYSLNRPSEDNSATEYVHIPQNPHWGDIWIKNKRSKDDIGHMLRGIATLSNCAGLFGSTDTEQDYVTMTDKYGAWARRVEDDLWTIATLNKAGNLWFPPDDLAHFIGLGNVECDAMLSIRLFGRGDPGTFKCGSGIHPLEFLAVRNVSNGEILRSFHEAAAKHALLANQPTVAKDLIVGLAQRVANGVKLAELGPLPEHLPTRRMVDLVVHAATTGVPLTWREVRWLHQQIESAHAGYLSPYNLASARLFDPATPDGTYVISPWHIDMEFSSIGLLLGTCVGQYRNPAGMPVLDCDRVRAWAGAP